MSNLWLFEPIVLRILDKKRATAPLIRTTSALTIFHSGVKDNVIPSIAEATVNFRILPGGTTESIKQRIENLIDDERVTIKFMEGFGNNPSSVSDHQAFGFKLIEKTIGETFNQNNEAVLTAPFMLMGGTDSRHYEEVADNMYRFNPMVLHAEDIKRFHGINERIATEDYLNMIRFFHRFIQNLNENN